MCFEYFSGFPEKKNIYRINRASSAQQQQQPKTYKKRGQSASNNWNEMKTSHIKIQNASTMHQHEILLCGSKTSTICYSLRGFNCNDKLQLIIRDLRSFQTKSETIQLDTTTPKIYAWYLGGRFECCILRLFLMHTWHREGQLCKEFNIEFYWHGTFGIFTFVFRKFALTKWLDRDDVCLIPFFTSERNFFPPVFASSKSASSKQPTLKDN